MSIHTYISTHIIYYTLKKLTDILNYKSSIVQGKKNETIQKTEVFKGKTKVCLSTSQSSVPMPEINKVKIDCQHYSLLCVPMSLKKLYKCDYDTVQQFACLFLYIFNIFIKI